MKGERIVFVGERQVEVEQYEIEAPTSPAGPD